MTALGRIEKRYGDLLRLIADRLRGQLLRARGAGMGEKPRVGRHCIVWKPWCLRAGDRLQLEGNVFIKIVAETAELRLGREVFIGYGTELDVASRICIGNHVLIAPGCFITDHGHRHGPHAPIAAQGCESAPVVIGDDVWLGSGVVVLPGVRIESGAVVGAGAVVTRDVEPGTIVAGVPARLIGRR